MKRVLDYVNNIIKKKMYYEIQEGEVIIEDLDGRIREFNNITKNYYEAEFTPSLKNGFVKIIDENDKGAKVYQGYISDECL